MEAVSPEIKSTRRDAHSLRRHAWRFGLAALGSGELIALALGGDRKLGDKLLTTCGGLPELARGSARELAQVTGNARGVRLAAAFELGRRAIEHARDRDVVGNAEDVFRLVGPRLAGLAQEVFLVIGVDIHNGLIEIVEVARGSLIAVVVHPREVFRPLIRMAAAGAVLVHNHPSGDPTPSGEDVELTDRLREVGSLIGIPIVDHVVVGNATYRSLGEGSKI